MNSMESNADIPSVLQQANELTAGGAWDEAIQLLTETNRLQENERLENRLVKFRHLAFEGIGRSNPGRDPSRITFPG